MPRSFRLALLPVATFVILTLCWGSCASAEPPLYTIRGIGTGNVDSTEHSYSTADVINNRGQVLGVYEDFDAAGKFSGDHTVFWDNGAITQIPTLYSDTTGRHLTIPNHGGEALLDNGQALLRATKYYSDNTGYWRALVWRDGVLTDLGDLAGNQGNGATIATTINSSGHILAFSNKLNGRGSFLWHDGTIDEIGPFTSSARWAPYTEAYAMNSNGLVVGVTSNYDSTGEGKGFRGFSWQNGSGAELPILGTDQFGSGSGYANAVNDAGQIAGSSAKYDSSGALLGGVAVIWDHGKIIELNEPSPSRSFDAQFINQAGQVLGSTLDDSGPNKGYRTFFWSNGALSIIPAPSTDGSGYGFASAKSLNNAGQIIGNYRKYAPGSNQNQIGDVGFFWDDGTLYPLEFSTDSTGHAYTELSLLTEDGNVYGDYRKYITDTNWSWKAFIWNPTDGLMELDSLIPNLAAQGWLTLTKIYDVNDVGQVVGYGTRLNGNLEGFVLTPISAVPEPLSLMTLLSLITLVLIRRR